MLRFSKLVNLTTGLMFSKIKAAPVGAKPVAPGFKPAPSTLKSAPLNQANLKPAPKPNVLQTKPVQQKKETVQQEPIIKQKHAVITIMGHVDHGKTTLIDFLRNSDIAAKEDGGITQRIGAFRINCLGRRLTFIDTPGHEAFVNMRQRGASVTDMVVLVVSAVEGVKQQTLEVIQLIKKLEIPVIIAINKIDLPQANPEQTEAELEKAGLNLEANGGTIPVVHISAKTGLNIELLCELLIEQTKNATAIFNGLACASVLEAYQSKDGLNSMTVIVEKGVLKNNAILIIGKESFKVKTILDDRGQVLQEAFPGEAVQVVGLPFIPAPGDIVMEVQNQTKAKFMLQKNINKNYDELRKTKGGESEVNATKIHFERSRAGRKQKKAFCRGVRQVWMNKFVEEEQKLRSKIQELKKTESNEMAEMAIMELEDELEKHQKYVHEYLKNTGNSPDTLNFIMKFGDRGMEETILLKLQTLKPTIQTETKVKLNLIKTDVGDVTISDLEQAINCGAEIFTFGAGLSIDAKSYSQGPTPRVHKLIHTFLKDLKDVSFNKKLSIIKGVERARCEVAQIFTIKLKKKQTIVPGIKVTSGKFTKKCKVYIFREGVPVSSALDINFIKSFKKDMLELKRGEEGTLGFVQEEVDIQKGDELVFNEQ